MKLLPRLLILLSLLTAGCRSDDSALLDTLKRDPAGSPDAATWFVGLSLEKKREYAAQLGHIVLEADKGGGHEGFVVAFGSDHSPYPWAFLVGKDRLGKDCLELSEGNSFEYVLRDDRWVKNQWGVYWVVGQGYATEVAGGRIGFKKRRQLKPPQPGVDYDVWTPAAGWKYVGPKLPKSKRVLRGTDDGNPVQ
jgi:hypothetical protein